MKVLSLFDGMSCGRIALDQLGIPVETYYASEIDKYAIQVSQANYPDIIQVGDVCDLDPKDFQDVNLILFGSPCQGFSFAGKQLAFDDPRSKLFFEAVRLLKGIKPKYFLAENVRMKKEFLEIFTEQLSACYDAKDVAPQFVDLVGNVRFEPIFINSSLVSAQSRQRYYWTNIPRIKQPEERGIVLRDILETETDEQPVKDTERNQRHYRDEDEKSLCMTATMYKGAGNNGMTLVPNKPNQINPSKKASGKQPYIQDRVFHEDGKSHSLTASFADRTNVATRPIKVGMNVEQVKIRKHEVDIVGLQQCILSHYAKCGMSKKEIAKQLNDKYSTVEHYFRNLGSEYFAIPSDEHWPQLKEILNIKTNKYDKSIMEFEYRDGVFESTQRVYSEEGKSPTLTASNKDQMIETTTSDNGITNIKKGTSGKSWFFEQQTYSKDSKKTRSLKSSSGSGNIPKVIETKPKQVGTAVDVNGHDVLKRVYSPDGKSPTVNTCQGGNREPKVVVGGALRARSKDKDGKHVGWKETKPEQMLELRKDNKSNAVSSVSKDSLVVKGGRVVGRAYDKDGRRMDRFGDSVAGKTKQTLEVREDNKTNAITTVGKDSVVVEENLTWRKLTPLECERLQTVPDNYTNHVSNTQRYKMLGNGWTVEVIKHIFKNMEY
jgi:DNA-cytosine methyltransferase